MMDLVKARNEMRNAAARDMLAALKAYKSTYDSTNHHPTSSEELRVILLVRAAIAKAEACSDLFA